MKDNHYIMRDLQHRAFKKSSTTPQKVLPFQNCDAYVYPH